MLRSLCLTLAISLLAGGVCGAQQPASMRIEAPELEGVSEWINTKPLKLADLKGQVVVLHFWTFGCVNCIHNYPCYREWQENFAKKNVTILGVHAPETEGEQKREKIKKKMKENKLTFPVAVDNDLKTWKAWDNRYWPSVYLIDKKGFVRYRWDGELNWKGVKGQEIMKKKIEELLDEKE